MTRRTIQALMLAPFCRNYGHLFVRDSFFGIPIGKPYCIRCGRKARDCQ